MHEEQHHGEAQAEDPGEPQDDGTPPHSPRFEAVDDGIEQVGQHEGRNERRQRRAQHAQEHEQHDGDEESREDPADGARDEVAVGLGFAQGLVPRRPANASTRDSAVAASG